MLGLTQCYKTTNVTAHSVNWVQEWKSEILKTVRTSSPTTKYALERCPSRECQQEAVTRPEYPSGHRLFAKGEFHEQFRTHDRYLSHGPWNRSRNRRSVCAS